MIVGRLRFMGRPYMLVDLLAIRNIPARMVQGLRLVEGGGEGRIEPWLLVHTGTEWRLLDPRTAAEGLPADLLLWNVSPDPLLVLDSEARPSLRFTVGYNLADAMAIAERISAMVPPEGRRSDHSDLYDDAGLPK